MKKYQCDIAMPGNSKWLFWTAVASVATLCGAMLLSLFSLNGCVVAAGAAAGGAAGYVTGHEAGKNEARDEIDEHEKQEHEEP